MCRFRLQDRVRRIKIKEIMHIGTRIIYNINTRILKIKKREN